MKSNIISKVFWSIFIALIFAGLFLFFRITDTDWLMFSKTTNITTSTEYVHETVSVPEPVCIEVRLLKQSDEEQIISTTENLDVFLQESEHKHIVAIDPGHQAKGNFEKEPIGPGATTLKNKTSAGTYGRTTGVMEYVLTLEVALQLKEELIARGYEVFMTRETHDVILSNAQRATMASESGAEIFIRIHADGSDSPYAKGMTAVCPTAKNPFCPEIYEDSRALSDALLSNLLLSTDTDKGKVWETDTMSGINWSKIPVSIIEMGFMTNKEEDLLMQTKEYQQKLVEGFANGIDAYFDR